MFFSFKYCLTSFFLIYRFLRYLWKLKFYAAVAHSETQTRELQHSSRRPTAGGRFRMFQLLNQSNSQIWTDFKVSNFGRLIREPYFCNCSNLVPISRHHVHCLLSWLPSSSKSSRKKQLVTWLFSNLLTHILVKTCHRKGSKLFHKHVHIISALKTIDFFLNERKTGTHVRSGRRQ